jgi:hypothetical protein
MSVKHHNDLENILSDVKRLRLQGLTARRIAAEIDRMGYKRPAPTVAWQTYHILQLIAELRKRKEIPPIGQLRAQSRPPAQKLSCHCPKY